jgi:hypothetical protein
MEQTIAGVARAAMLVSLNVSLYSGRKQDKRTQAEVVAAKGSGSSRAASVYKNLFTDCPELEAIVKFQAKARMRHYQLTLPWNDNGVRLLPSRALLDYKTEMNRFEGQFYLLVEAFLNKYDTLIAAAAFKLGTLFDRDEYLLREQVARRFRFDLDFTPLPTAGDFRLDIESEVQRELVEKYEARMATQLAAAQQDAWTRMHDAISRLKDRLTLNEDGTRRTFHDTTVINAQELCGLLTQLNVTNDPALEKARRQLEEALDGVDPKELRKEEGERLVVLAKVSTLLDSFDWGVDDEEAEATV